MKMLEEKLTMELTDKINRTILHIENEMKNANKVKETKICIISSLILDHEQNEKIIKQRMELLEKAFNNLNSVTEKINKNIELFDKYKKSNNENILEIQNIVNRMNLQFPEMNDKINQLFRSIEEKYKKYNEVNILVCQLQSRMNKVIEKHISDMDTTKRIESLRKEFLGISCRFDLMPIISGWQNCVDINSEKLIFNWGSSISGAGSMNICLDDVENVLFYDMLKYRSNIKYVTDEGYKFTGPLKFLEQFKKIKSLYFEFTICDINGQNRDMIIQMFPLLLELNPSMEIHYKCKDYPPVELMRDAIFKTNKYSSFNLVVLNNYTKDASSGNMRFVSNQIWDSLKEHCVKNHITFTSNIGL
jgi:hypothetical protein